MHPFGDLSAYLDGALSSEAQASVQAHLDSCALCRTRLAELRGTARLIAALPMPVPSRSLIPRVAVSPWMAPLRTVSTFASAAAIFVFLASAAISSFPQATSSGSAVAPAASAPNGALDQARGGATSAPAAPQSSLDLNYRSPASASASPGAAFNIAPSPTPVPAERAATSSDAAKRVDAPSPSPSGDLAVAARSPNAPGQAPFNPFPWLWLVLGIAFAALSFILGRRLRSV